ncbi:MAG: hypothetical protein ACK4HW_11805 [Roseinatronobacter sp.]
MGIAFRILPDLGLIAVRYEGVAQLQETMVVLSACAAHPDFHPAFRHVVDLRAVTDFERDMLGFFKMQAQAIEKFPQNILGEFPFHMVMLAPPGAPWEMADLVRRTWEGLGLTIVRVVDTPDAVVDLLGLRAKDAVRMFGAMEELRR